MSPQEPAPADAVVHGEPSGPQVGRLVRRPRYLQFLVTGFLVGVLATAVVSALFGDQVDEPRQLALYLGVLLGGVGALLGGAVAVWLERDRRTH